MNNNEKPDNVSNNNTSGESSVIGNKKRKRLSTDHVLPSWKKVNPNYTRSYPTSENKTKDDLILLTKNKTAVEIFELLFDNDLMENIVRETKRYAFQRNIHNFDMTVNCLKNVIGIFIYTGYNSLPQEKMYWSEDEDIDRTIIRQCMSRNRYYEIKRNIHFNNNDNISRSTDRIFKIRPLIEQLNKNFIQFGIFSEKISIDEQMVRYYGHHFMKQFIRGKPIRFGLKQWVIACGTTGYCYKMDVYEGKIADEMRNNGFNSLTGVGENIVLNMVNTFENPESHAVYIDNLFTSYTLLTELNKNGIRCTGIARYNRMGFSKTGKNNLKSDLEMKKVNRGVYDYRFDNNNEILSVTWKDNNIVKLMSNRETVEPLVAVKRYCKKEKKYVDIYQPNLINSYNKYMGELTNWIGMYRSTVLKFEERSGIFHCSQTQ
ncbi:transposase is4 [Holotrichia oblita]|uniref:Transposase is4 n=1 Tax=Holotrichia oblita TaxID=644536 RepID=A0ACB9TGS0_HOLOL|nr:transposase is4 [Holotrichia oblita]